MPALTRRFVALMRHGQSESNLVGHSKSIFDPNLTAKGENDARQARQWFEHSYSAIPSLVLTSTLSRAIQTSVAAFSDLMDPLASTTPSSSQSDSESSLSPQGESLSSMFVPIFATDFVREIVGGGCIAETRRSIDELKCNYSSVDFRLFTDDSTVHDPMKHYALCEDGEGPGERLAALNARGAKVANALWSLPWTPRYETVAIVSHYYFLQKFVEGLIADDEELQRSLAIFLKKWPNGAVLILAFDAPPSTSNTPNRTDVNKDPVAVLREVFREDAREVPKGTISVRSVSVAMV